MSISETGLKIKILGDTVLRRRVKPVAKITGRHRDTLSKMAQLMYAAKGIGLAASQIGLSESLAVIDIGNGLYKLINPKIIKGQGRQAMEEGCLSVPGISVKIRRAKKILVEAQDENGKPLRVEAEGLLACVFQHEIDHLNGKLIIDHATLRQKLKIRKKLQAIKKAGTADDKPIANLV